MGALLSDILSEHIILGELAEFSRPALDSLRQPLEIQDIANRQS